MNILQFEVLRFIKFLADSGYLAHMVLIGSWAEYLYRETSLLPGFSPDVDTPEVDFLLRKTESPLPRRSLALLAEDAGYLIERDGETGSAGIKDLTGLAMEFFVSKADAGDEGEDVCAGVNLGVPASVLHHMEPLKNTVEVEYFSMNIAVPVPEAYVLQKMIISKERGIKQEQDRQAVRRIWPYLSNAKLRRLFESLEKRERFSAELFMAEENICF